MKMLEGPPGSTPPRLRRYLTFDPDTGRILYHASGLTVSPSNTPGHFHLEEFSYYDGADFWIQDGKPVPRPPTPITLAYTPNRYQVILGGVPHGATVRVTGAADVTITQDSADAIMVLTFGAKGYYHIHCDTFPARDFVAEVKL